jgi:hypothetical protein
MRRDEQSADPHDGDQCADLGSGGLAGLPQQKNAQDAAGCRAAAKRTMATKKLETLLDRVIRNSEILELQLEAAANETDGKIYTPRALQRKQVDLKQIRLDIQKLKAIRETVSK